MDWLLRPVIKGMCSYESLLNGTLGLEDILRMNTALDVMAENQMIAEQAARKD
jgi:hypothetical protein